MVTGQNAWFYHLSSGRTRVRCYFVTFVIGWSQHISACSVGEVHGHGLS